ncbi:hypothetical protein DSO57_1018568 [Entomophthora muscae]|uniref:Uncharacterized protein n=1 Tax=Entomophthora muscae TaxID=34485 RepID=A0ACC2UF08_9FUNG|nr:hypothetical protein DSO57_1018568 [Entomophthora muscae]
MKFLTATLISLVAGQAPFINKPSPFTWDQDFTPGDGQHQVTTCDRNDCLLSAKPHNKKVYIGLHLEGGSLTTHLDSRDLEYASDIYIRPDPLNSVLTKYDGMHIFFSPHPNSEGYQDFIAGIPLDEGSIFPKNARITISYTDEPAFANHVTVALPKFNQVLISIQDYTSLSEELKNLLASNDKIFIETSGTIAARMSKEINGLKYLVKNVIEGKEGQVFSSDVQVCKQKTD